MISTSLLDEGPRLQEKEGGGCPSKGLNQGPRGPQICWWVNATFWNGNSWFCFEGRHTPLQSWGFHGNQIIYHPCWKPSIGFPQLRTKSWLITIGHKSLQNMPHTCFFYLPSSHSSPHSSPETLPPTHQAHSCLRAFAHAIPIARNAFLCGFLQLRHHLPWSFQLHVGLSVSYHTVFICFRNAFTTRHLLHINLLVYCLLPLEYKLQGQGFLVSFFHLFCSLL